MMYVYAEFLAGTVVGMFVVGFFHFVVVVVESIKEVRMERDRLKAFRDMPRPEITIQHVQLEDKDNADWWKDGRKG